MAAPSQTLPMVDGGWGGLQAHSITSIGYHLAFRAGGLRARSDARSAAAESGARRRGYAHPQRELAIPMQKKLDSRTPHTMGSATICLDSHGYARFSLEVRKTSVRAFVNPTADDLKIGPRRDRQL